MADTKLSALAALAGTDVAVGDLFYVDDISVTTSKSITAAEMRIAMLSTQGSFTITLTGFTAGVTGTAYYSVTNNVVTLFIPSLSGTSNTTAMTATGLPAAITPATNHSGYPIVVNDNSATIANYARVDIINNSTLVFYTTVAGGAWTASGSKGIPIATSITYNLN